MAGFRDIVGHEQIIAHLKNAIAMDKVSHAYIINGPEKCGKRMLAEAFAMALQCTELQKTRESANGVLTAASVDACTQCRSCRQAAGRNQPDILYVTHDKPNTISVDDVRKQINADVCIRPYGSRYKVYIVDEAEKMNVQAQNALLKTIEEPPSYAVILLLTVNSELFLPTIRSRCITLECRAAEDKKIREHLMRRCQVTDYKADICVAFAQGNVGRAVQLAASDSFNEWKDFTLQLVRRIGGIPKHELLGEVKKLGELSGEPGDFLDLLVLWYRDVLLYKATGEEDRLLFKDRVYELAGQAAAVSYPGVQKILEEIETARRRIRANVNRELTLELLLLTIKENMT